MEAAGVEPAYVDVTSEEEPPGVEAQPIEVATTRLEALWLGCLAAKGPQTAEALVKTLSAWTVGAGVSWGGEALARGESRGWVEQAGGSARARPVWRLTERGEEVAAAAWGLERWPAVRWKVVCEGWAVGAALGWEAARVRQPLKIDTMVAAVLSEAWSLGLSADASLSVVKRALAWRQLDLPVLGPFSAATAEREVLEATLRGGAWSAGPGSAGLGSAGLGSAGLGSAGLGSAGLGSAGLGSAGLGVGDDAEEVAAWREALEGVKGRERSKLVRVGLAARAAGVPAPRTREDVRALVGADGLTAAVVARRLGLGAVSSFPTLKEVQRALVWARLGEERADAISERVVLGRYLGEDKAPTPGVTLKRLAQRALGARATTPKALRDALIQRWLREDVREDVRAEGPRPVVEEPVVEEPVVEEPVVEGSGVGALEVGPSAEEVLARVRSAYRKLQYLPAYGDGFVPIPVVFDQVRRAIPGLGIEALHGCLESAGGRGLELHVCNDLRDVERPELGLRRGERLLYFVYWPEEVLS